MVQPEDCGEKFLQTLASQCKYFIRNGCMEAFHLKNVYKYSKDECLLFPYGII